MMQDLFDAPAPPKPTHDPGGKVATPLPKGMWGYADFHGDNGQYRLWLSRQWGALEKAVQNIDELITSCRYVLWIGMNPSTAMELVNDPTVTREIGFSKTWGYEAYVKCNVMDYRATKPKDLWAPGVVPCSDRNHATILKAARRADQIICCSGVPPHKSLECYAQHVYKMLHEAGHQRKMFAFGYTLMGHPRHSLYLPSDKELEPFR
jgi:hypothetical protein